jgi:reversibly glycosylated polypeptide/UDP-arabinopyranose mutase
MNILVVPTIREDCLKAFFNSWYQELFDKIIIVEDNPKITFKSESVEHYSWNEIEEEWGKNWWIFSRRDSAIRSFGFWKAYQLDAETIFTLDDDCYRIPNQNFIETHLARLNNTPKWVSSIDNLRLRGLPYFNLGKLHNVVLNMGMWTNVADLDAPNQLTKPLPNFMPPTDVDRIIPNGQYFPLCGMNMAFKREITPLMYFPLMGEGQPYRRFDDIWCGIICKTICDHLKLNISVGHPFVEHKKASDPMVNLVKEAPGIKMNETFWEVINAVNLTALTPKDCMIEMGERLQKCCSATADNPYIGKLGEAMTIWASGF